ncbi:MAG: hypothetical protein E6729_05505, partial [Finegoldia magna]|nr:hypothetical protein [Finegoldia magna]
KLLKYFIVVMSVFLLFSQESMASYDGQQNIIEQKGDGPTFDPDLSGAFIDSLETCIYNRKGELVELDFGKPISIRNNWVKFGDDKLKYEDIAKNEKMKYDYSVKAMNFIRWVNNDGKIDKSKRYDDIKDRDKAGTIRFRVTKNQANQQPLRIILSNDETKDVYEVVVGTGKQLDKAFNYGKYTIYKVYQDDEDFSNFQINISKQQINVSEKTRFQVVDISVVNPDVEKAQQLQKQKDESKKPQDSTKKEDKKDSDKKDDEIVLKPTEKQALINKQKELENTRNMKLLLVFAVFAVVVVAGGYVFYKKR